MNIRRFLPISFFWIFILSAAGGCRKDSGLVAAFQMLYQQQFTIQPGLSTFVTHHFYLKNIQTRYQALLDQSNLRDEDIKSIVLSQAVINGVFSDADYGIILTATLDVYDEDSPASSIEIAYRDPVPIDPGSNLPLIPNDVNIKPYLSDPRFSVDLAITLRGITQVDIPTRLDLVFTAQRED